MDERPPIELSVATAVGGAELIMKLSAGDLADGVRVLAVTGELDTFSAPMLCTEIVRELAASPRHLVLDLSEVSFLGCSGIAVLLRARQDAQQAGVVLRLVSTTRAVRRPITLTGLAGTLALHVNRDDALFDESERPSSARSPLHLVD